MSNFNVYKYFNNRRLVENEENDVSYLLEPTIKMDLNSDVYKIIKANKNIQEINAMLIKRKNIYF